MYQGVRNLRGGGGIPYEMARNAHHLAQEPFHTGVPPPSFGEKGAEISGLGGNSSHCN